MINVGQKRGERINGVLYSTYYVMDGLPHWNGYHGPGFVIFYNRSKTLDFLSPRQILHDTLLLEPDEKLDGLL